MKKGLIFDMDGTLWDSAENVAASWNLAVASAGYHRNPLTRWDLERVMGKTMDELGAALFPDIEEEERSRLLLHCYEVENDYIRKHGGILYPNLVDTLHTLRKDYHLYIVSNCQAGYIEAFLDHYDLWDLFEDIECFGNNGLPKGQNIRLLTERNGLEKAAYIGDIQGDYDATMEAGLPFIHAAYGFGSIRQPVEKASCVKDIVRAAAVVLGDERNLA